MNGGREGFTNKLIISELLKRLQINSILIIVVANTAI